MNKLPCFGMINTRELDWTIRNVLAVSSMTIPSFPMSEVFRDDLTNSFIPVKSALTSLV